MVQTGAPTRERRLSCEPHDAGCHPGVGLRVRHRRPHGARVPTPVREKSEASVERGLGRVLETSPFPILLVCLVGIVLLSVFAPSIVVGDTWLTLMAGREVVRARAARHRAPDRPRPGQHVDRPAVARPDRVLRRPRPRRHARRDPARDRVRAPRARTRLRDRPDERRVVAVDLRRRLSSRFSPARGAGRCARRPRRFRSSQVFSGCSSTRRGADLAGRPCSCSRSSSSGRTSTARSSSAPASRCFSGSSSWCAHVGSRGSPSRSSSSHPRPSSRRRTGRSSSPTTTSCSSTRRSRRSCASGSGRSPTRQRRSSGSSRSSPSRLLAMRRCRSRLTFYELAVLAVTFVGAVQAVRGVIWFALAAAAILPVALDGVLTKADVARRGSTGSSRSRRWPGLPSRRSRSSSAPRRGTSPSGPSRGRGRPRGDARPERPLWATDGTADWLLWRIPDLRGRIAYDVRFELYDAARRSTASSGTGAGRATGRPLLGRLPRGRRRPARTARRAPWRARNTRSARGRRHRDRRPSST